MPDEQRRLAWTAGKYNGHTGTAGGDVALFTINFHTKTTDPSWFMRTSLPGLHHKTWKNDSRDELKDQAEKVFDAWLTHVGAFTLEPKGS